jgi:hypothetical protein
MGWRGWARQLHGGSIGLQASVGLAPEGHGQFPTPPPMFSGVMDVRSHDDDRHDVTTGSIFSPYFCFSYYSPDKR